MRTTVVLIFLLTAGLAGCFDGGDDLREASPSLSEPPEAAGAAFHMPVSSFEPTIGVTSSGALFMTGGDTPAGPTHQTLFRSTDDGRTWEDVTANLAGVTNYPPNSNDPYVYVDQDTDRVFDFEMQGLSCNMLAFSDDEGDSWEARPLGCTPTQGLQDHQTFFSAYPREVNGVMPPTVGYEKVVYYCVNRVVDSGCSASFDSGLTWGPFRPLVYPGADTGGFCGGLHAHGAAHPDGTIYLPKGQCGRPSVAISEDNALTWTEVTISDDVEVMGHEVNVAADDEGNVFATWISTDRHVYFAASYDRGYTWTDAQRVTGPGITMTYFPVIAAAGDGNVAIVYIGTDADPELEYDELDKDDHWHGYMTVGYGMGEGVGNATWNTVRVNPEDDPLAIGYCAPTRCDGMGDFLDVEIGPDGRPWGAFVDVCHEHCLKNDEHDKALGMVGTLATGTPLRGDALELPAIAHGGAPEPAPQPSATSTSPPEQ